MPCKLLGPSGAPLSALSLSRLAWQALRVLRQEELRDLRPGEVRKLEPARPQPPTSRQTRRYGQQAMGSPPDPERVPPALQTAVQRPMCPCCRQGSAVGLAPSEPAPAVLGLLRNGSRCVLCLGRSTLSDAMSSMGIAKPRLLCRSGKQPTQRTWRAPGRP